MSEYSLQFIVFGKFILLSVYALLYGLGGISNKWIRRFVAPIVLMAGMFFLSSEFSLWYLLYTPLLIGALTLPYGADTTGTKVIKRLIVGLALASAPLSIFIVHQSWIMLGVHLALCLTAHIVFGVFNPVNPRMEESLIAFLSAVIPVSVV